MFSLETFSMNKMPSRIIYTGTCAQIYRLKESKSSNRFLNLPAYLNDFLVKEKGAEGVMNKDEDEFDIFHYNNTTIKAIYSEQGNQIKAFGTKKQISAIEKGLAKKLKQAEVSFEEMYKHQPFRQNEILQEKLIEAVRIRHQEFLSNAKNF